MVIFGHKNSTSGVFVDEFDQKNHNVAEYARNSSTMTNKIHEDHEKNKPKVRKEDEIEKEKGRER